MLPGRRGRLLFPSAPAPKTVTKEYGLAHQRRRHRISSDQPWSLAFDWMGNVNMETPQAFSAARMRSELVIIWRLLVLLFLSHPELLVSCLAPFCASSCFAAP